MSADRDANPLPVFEIDRAEDFAQFLVSENTEIISYLRALQARRAGVTIHIDDGRLFFPSLISALDTEKRRIVLDTTKTREIGQQVDAAEHITLTANLDKVKIQARFPARDLVKAADGSTLSVPLPRQILRLQRREYFRLTTPQVNELSCQLVVSQPGGTARVLNLPLLDMSGNGVSLSAPPAHIDSFSPGSIFKDCRLAIPGEGILLLNLCIREVLAGDDHPGLRLGCEFHNLTLARRSQIQRYIARQEREQKARGSGLT